MQLNYFQVLAGLVLARVAWIYLIENPQPSMRADAALSNGVTSRMRGLQNAGALSNAGNVEQSLAGGRPFGRMQY